MNKDNFDFENEIPETPKMKFSDLDLGLDFDLSFLDDLDESVLEEEAPVEEAPVEMAPPAKKSVPAKKAPAAKKQAAPETPVKKAAPAKKTAPVQQNSASAPKKAPAKKPAPVQEEPVQPKKQKKGPRVGSVIFYTIYFLFILAFFGATYLGLTWLHGWLTDFEAAQPTLKAEQVFQEVFTDPDWGALYEAAGAKDSPYEGKDQYVNYMEEKVGDTTLTYMETSAGLDKTKKKFIVKLGDEKVATFTLTDRNKVGDLSLGNLTNLENIKDMADDIPDWQLGAVEVFFERVGTYYIVKMGDHTASVNGVELDDSFTIQKATTVAEKYLPEGTYGFVTCIQQIDGLMEVPTVVITDKDGNPVEVTYDEAARTFVAKTESNTISDELDTIALEAAKVYSLWMIDEEHDRAKVAKYFDASSDAYSRIVKSTELWMQNHAGYRFENDSVTDYARYSDDICSVKVKTDLIVTRVDGSEKVYAFNQSMFFRKNDAGKWLCFESTNVDVAEPVGKVRLTFMQGDTQLTTDFYETDAKEVITPKLPVPEGQVFSGWVTVSKNENGDTVYNVEFQPGEDGTVKLPEGNTLKPMTLYALFQDASEAAAEPVPAETAPQETVAPETTEGA